MEVQTLYNGYWDHSFLTDSISAEFPLEYTFHLLFSVLVLSYNVQQRQEKWY